MSCPCIVDNTVASPDPPQVGVPVTAQVQLWPVVGGLRVCVLSSMRLLKRDGDTEPCGCVDQRQAHCSPHSAIARRVAPPATRRCTAVGWAGGVQWAPSLPYFARTRCQLTSAAHFNSVSRLGGGMS